MYEDLTHKSTSYAYVSLSFLEKLASIFQSESPLYDETAPAETTYSDKAASASFTAGACETIAPRTTLNIVGTMKAVGEKDTHSRTNRMNSKDPETHYQIRLFIIQLAGPTQNDDSRLVSRKKRGGVTTLERIFRVFSKGPRTRRAMEV